MAVVDEAIEQVVMYSRAACPHSYLLTDHVCTLNPKPSTLEGFVYPNKAYSSID